MNTTIALTIDTQVEEIAKKFVDRVALQIFKDGELLGYTYAQLVEEFKAGAVTLQRCGVKPGDRVILLAENSPEWMIAYLAALAAKTTVVLLDPSLMPADLAELIARSDPRALLVSQRQYEKLPFQKNFELPILNIHDSLNPFDQTSSTVHPSVLPTPDPDPTIAALIFTSGTTGKPKGVLLSHTGILHSATCGMDCVGFRENDPPHSVLCVLPLHHIAALTISFTALLMGATLTFIETVQGETILAAMRASKTTILPSVPRLLDLLYSEIQRQVAAKGWLTQQLFHAMGIVSDGIRSVTSLNLAPVFFRPIHQAFGGHLKLCLCGAAPLSPEVEQGMERLGFTVLKGYGLTETGVAVFNALGQSRFRHVGKPIPGVEVRVGMPVKDAMVITDPVESAGEGEICLRGMTLMRGYFRDEAATQEAIREGWFHSGDIGHFDWNGNLVITGRLKELIVTPSGKKAAPEAVEQYYQHLPGVKEFAVFGYPVPKGYGEAIHAAFVLDRAHFPEPVPVMEAQRSLELAIAARAAEISSYLRIQQVHVVEALPKTTTLKVKRSQLQREIANRQHDAADLFPAPDLRALEASDPADETSRQVMVIVGEIAQQMGQLKQITPKATLQFDLGIDSLGLMELAAKLEQAFGVQLNADLLPSLHTVQALTRWVQEALTAQAAVTTQTDSLTDPSPQPDLLDGELAESVPAPRTGLKSWLLYLFRVVSPLIWRIEVKGIEHLPTNGPYILCPNQESDLDTFWVSSCLPPFTQYNLCCVTKREAFEKPLTRFLASLVGGIPINREGNSLPALRGCAKALRSGHSLIIYPEGTRTRNGELLPFFRGPAKLSLTTGVPLIPVRLKGSYAIYPFYRRVPRLFNWRQIQRLPLEISFGHPISPPDHPPSTTSEMLLIQRLREAIEVL